MRAPQQGKQTRGVCEKNPEVESEANGRAGVNDTPGACQSREVTEPQRDRILSGFKPSIQN